jgi:hypothetical protein
VSPFPNQEQQYEFPENITINPVSGLVSWDTKFHEEFKIGQFLFAIKINQFDNNGRSTGYIIRTIQVILEDSEQQLKIITPAFSNNEDLKVLVPVGQKKESIL